MEKAAGYILKGDQVNLEGKIQIGIQQVDSAQIEKTEPSGTIHQVQIVEKHPEFAVVEIICSCGARALLRCEYAGMETAREVSEDEQIDR
jgi:hypothetical protein